MSELKMNDPAEARRFFAEKLNFTTGPMELSKNLKQGTSVNVIDLRDEKDYRKGHVPGAINLPRERWSTCEGLDKDELNVLYCYTQQCHLAADAAVEFAGKGYSVMEMDGGFEAWKANKLEVATTRSDVRAGNERSGIYF